LKDEVLEAIRCLLKVEEELGRAVERCSKAIEARGALGIVRIRARRSREFLEELLEEEVGNPEPRSELEVLQARGVRERQRVRRALREGCLVELVEEVRELRKVLEKLVEELRRLRTDRLSFT